MSPNNSQGYCAVDNRGQPVAVGSQCQATIACRPAKTPCITRTPGFWFTRPLNPDPKCVTLLAAIQANGGRLDLGFMCLPTGGCTNDLTSYGALREALGFFWMKRTVTGDKSCLPRGCCVKVSQLGQARKKLAFELIAAIANRTVFGTQPGDCLQTKCKCKCKSITVGPFPSDLIEQAQQAGACGDVNKINQLADLLDQFNQSGDANPVPPGMYECSANPTLAGSIALDPTTTSILNSTAHCSAGHACP